MLVTVMANVAYGGMGNAGAVALILQALKLDILYGVKVLTNSAGFQILLALSINLTGFGCAGILRRFLVYPPVMLRPVNFWRKIPVILSGGVMWATYNFAMSGLQWWLGSSSTTTSSGDTRRGGKHMPT
jgi:hypothetical protein